jgi:hypothetical protein
MSSSHDSGFLLTLLPGIFALCAPLAVLIAGSGLFAAALVGDMGDSSRLPVSHFRISLLYCEFAGCASSYLRLRLRLGRWARAEAAALFAFLE